MDPTIVDIPTLISSIVAIVVAVGGVAGRNYIKKAIENTLIIAMIVEDVADLIKTVAMAGEDEKLTPEEWTSIREKANNLKKAIGDNMR